MEVVGYLLEELRDAKNYEAFKQDMQSANIFIGSLIFIEELADKVNNAKNYKIAVCSLNLRLDPVIWQVKLEHKLNISDINTIHNWQYTERFWIHLWSGMQKMSCVAPELWEGLGMKYR